MATLENKGMRLKKKINEDTLKAFMSFRTANEWIINKKKNKNKMMIIHANNNPYKGKFQFLFLIQQKVVLLIDYS